MEELLKSKDDEITKLLAENHDLLDELRQCQADKEFVWSLWKRLQVSSPDLTQAVSIIMEREKEKAELKDRKVLEILQTKDDEIKELQETVAALKLEKDEIAQKNVDVERELSKASLERQRMENEIANLTKHMQRAQLDSTDRSNSYRRALDEAERQKFAANEQITSLITDLQEMRTKVQSFEDENERIFNKNKQVENELKDKDSVIKRLMGEKDEAIFNLENAQRSLDHGVLVTKQDFKSKEKYYEELKDSYEQLTLHNQHQKDLISQLQELHKNTQKVAKEKEETSENEKRNLQTINNQLIKSQDSLKQYQAKLQEENSQLLHRIQLQDQALKHTEEELKKSIAMASGVRREYDYGQVLTLEEKIEQQRKEIEALQRKMKNSKASRRSRSSYNNDEVAEQTFSPIVERGLGRNMPRSRSLSPCAQSRQLLMMQKRLKATETKLDDTKQLLELKKDEVKEIQKAHNKRLERLKSLQQDYRLLKSGCNNEDGLSSPKRSKSRHRKSDPRNLRHENSDSVWNDLAHYKQENRVLSQERMQLEEEIDALRVQSAMDRATIQDLNVCLKNERDELYARLRPATHAEDQRSSTPKNDQYTSKPSKRAVKNLERRLENALEDNRLLKKDKDRLFEGNRSLKNEVKSLKREITETRQSGTKLRQENNDLRRKIDAIKSDNHQLNSDVNEQRVDVESLRSENATLQADNSSLRAENNDQRQDIADLKLELADLQAELADINQTMAEAESQQRKPTSGARFPKSKTAKKHQAFLDQSIQELQDAFGGDFSVENPAGTPASLDTSAHEDVGEGRSDASSLGQNIVRASRRQRKHRAIDEDKDDDDTLLEESIGTHKALKRPSSLPKYGGGRMTVTLKQRLASLQTQCVSLRSAKQNAMKKINEEKNKNAQLESDLSTCQNKLKSAKQSIQRLNREVEVLQREREDFQKDLIDARNKQPDLPQHTDADYKYIEAKLKQSHNESSRAVDQIRELKKELEMKLDQLSAEKDKVSRLERDVSMKRQLIDEFRIKIKENETRVKEAHNSKLDLQDRLKLLEEDLTHKKNHVESIRRQLQVSTKEKSKYETMYNKSREELEKRCEQLTVVQASKLEAENVTSRLEQEAEQQLHTLATRSEQALEKLKGKLVKAEERLAEFSTFVQSLTSQLIELLCRQREGLLREKMNIADSQLRMSESSVKRPSSSMSHAQTVACNILNMSRSDFEDLMAPVDVIRKKSEKEDWQEEKTVSSQQDESWKLKVEKIATENPPFAKSLVRLLWDKIQDAVKLSEEKWRLQTDHLEEEIVSRKKLNQCKKHGSCLMGWHQFDARTNAVDREENFLR